MIRVYPDTNSRLVLDLVYDGKIHAVISDYSLKELKRVLRRILHKIDSDKRYYLFSKSVTLNPFFEVVSYKQYQIKEEKYMDLIVEKDLPHLVIAIEEKVYSIIGKDRHFNTQKLIPIKTPKEFLKELGIDVFRKST